jgi:hypothetical protein
MIHPSTALNSIIDCLEIVEVFEAVPKADQGVILLAAVLDYIDRSNRGEVISTKGVHPSSIRHGEGGLKLRPLWHRTRIPDECSLFRAKVSYSFTSLK